VKAQINSDETTEKEPVIYPGTPSEFLLPMQTSTGSKMTRLTREVLADHGIAFSIYRFRATRYDSNTHTYHFVVNLDPSFTPPPKPASVK